MPKIANVGIFCHFEVDLDELHILKITFRNGLEIGMGNFPQEFPTRFSCKISHKVFPQDFPKRISHKIFPQDFPEKISRKISHKIFPQEFPTRFSWNNFPATISRKIFLNWILIDWLPITLFQMLNFHQSLPFLNWLFPRPPCPARISHKIFPQEFPARISHKISCKIFPQDFLQTISEGNFQNIQFISI